MLVKTLLVLYSFVVLTNTRECEPGQDCLLRCCGISRGNVLCRERCLGLLCDHDAHCDGDCCVNSTCSSCLLKSISSTGSRPVRISTRPNSQNLSTTSMITADKAKVTSETKTMDQKDRFEVTRTSPTKRLKMNDCSRFDNKCLSNCCIDGKCVDRSLCVPVKSARGGRGGGGRGGGRSFRGGRSRGGYSGGGYSGNGSGSSSLPVWGFVLIIVGSVLIPVACVLIPLCIGKCT